MNRRIFLSQLSRGAARAGLVCGGRAFGAEAAKPNTLPAPRLSPLKITKVKAILTAPSRIRLCVVKVETSEPGLYGLGCATFTRRNHSCSFVANYSVEKLRVDLGGHRGHIAVGLEQTG